MVQWTIMQILRIVPEFLKTRLYALLVGWCERKGRRIDRFVYRLPFDLLVKCVYSGAKNEALALRFVETLGIDSARWIDYARADQYTHYTLMTYIHGDCCRVIWNDLTESDKHMLVVQLREIVHRMRELTMSSDHPICNLEGEVIRDPRIPWVARETPKVFTSSPEFFAQVWTELSYKVSPIGGGPPLEPLLRPIIDRTDRPIVFTHGDLLPQNILIPGGLKNWRNGRSKLCLIDWQNACYAPVPWEALKATWLCTSKNEGWYPMMKEVFPESCTELEADLDWRSRTHVILV